MSTGTKGPSNLYGNPSHRPTGKINFPYANNFNSKSLQGHFEDHGKGVNAKSNADYAKKAIEFANRVDTINHDSFVDERGTTWKYSYTTREFIMIKSDGTIITYYIAPRPNYWRNKKTQKGK